MLLIHNDQGTEHSLQSRMLSSYNCCTINAGFNEAGKQLMEVNDENTQSFVSLTNMQWDMVMIAVTVSAVGQNEDPIWSEHSSSCCWTSLPERKWSEE